ncbi:MAG: hypothetical protein BBJ57_02300 [Desulfobacterales bacterium PC51MH44]|nr:MAG: hypothetical protein BBJ57_02300 [Desulfobacterales bacterium PC51MH44]
MDRFNSTEDYKWHPEGESQGRMARLRGFDIISQNPFEYGSWLWKSFRAGWVDVDCDHNAPKIPIKRR